MTTNPYNGHPVTKRIGRMIKARTTLVGVLSAEETRVSDHIRRLAQEQEKALYVWTFTHGLRSVNTLTAEEGESIEGTETPEGALGYIYRDMAPGGEEMPEAWGDTADLNVPSQFGEPAIIIMKDLHHFISGPQVDALVIRGLRDLAAGLLNRRQTVILLSPSLNLPPELEKDVPRIDFPLPSPEEIAAQVVGFVDDLNERITRTRERIAIDLPDPEPLIQALCGLSGTEITAVLLQAVLEMRSLSLAAIPMIIQEKQAIIKACPALELHQNVTDFGRDVGGLDLLQGWAEMAAQANTTPAREFGITPPRSALLVGVPGCGKSLSVKAIAGAMQVPLVRLDFGSIFGSLLGESETTARTVLKIVEAIGPCVFWWDEVEKGLPSGQGSFDGGTTSRVFGTFLTWMQETEAQTLIVATANQVDRLPPEFYRRFTVTMFVDLPEIKPRREILRIHLTKRGRRPEQFDLNALAGATPNFTGDEIEKAIEEALRLAFQNGDPDITTGHIRMVIDSTVPLAESMKEQITNMRNWATRARPASSHQQSGSRPAGPLDFVEL